MLLSSHLLERVQSVCDRVALFSGGHIALMGSVAELGREVLGGGYVVDIEADGAGLAERLALIPGRQRRRARPASASCGCMPTATCGRKRRVEVVAMQGRLKFLGVQEPSLEAIYTRYFESQARQMARQEGARDAA